MKINACFCENVAAHRLEKGIGLSVLTHSIAIFLILSIPYKNPSAKPHLPLCNVSVISGKSFQELKIKGKSAEIMTETPQETKHNAKPPVKPEFKKKQLKASKSIKRTPAVSKEKPVIKNDALPTLLKNTEINKKNSHPVMKTGSELDNVPAASGDFSKKNTDDSDDASNSTDDQPYGASFGSSGGPGFIKQVVPRYPEHARERGREGIVILMVTVSESGHPVEVTVIEGAGFGFDEEAVKAVKKSTFSPVVRNGKPVACRAKLPVHFVLD